MNIITSIDMGEIIDALPILVNAVSPVRPMVMHNATDDALALTRERDFRGGV